MYLSISQSALLPCTFHPPQSSYISIFPLCLFPLSFFVYWSLSSNTKLLCFCRWSNLLSETISNTGTTLWAKMSPSYWRSDRRCRMPSSSFPHGTRHTHYYLELYGKSDVLTLFIWAKCVLYVCRGFNCQLWFVCVCMCQGPKRWTGSLTSPLAWWTTLPPIYVSFEKPRIASLTERTSKVSTHTFIHT